MEEHIQIRQENYEKASQLLGKLFEVDSDITEQIKLCIQRYGAGNFFNNLEAFEFSSSVYEKLQAVRMVLFGMGEETMKDMQKMALTHGKAKSRRVVQTYEEKL